VTYFWSDTWLFLSWLCFLFVDVAGDKKKKRKRRKERRLLVLGINFLVSFLCIFVIFFFIPFTYCNILLFSELCKDIVSGVANQ
jgi:amino acid transporter